MVTVSARVDENIKKQANEVLKNIGLDMSTAINVYLKQIIQSNSIPFELKADPFYSESNINHLKKVIHEYKTGEVATETHDLIEV